MAARIVGGLVGATTHVRSNTQVWRNLYGNLLEYVISAALIFYVLTVGAVFRLRWKRPQAVRRYWTWGYPVVPAAYIVTAGTILVGLFEIGQRPRGPGCSS